MAKMIWFRMYNEVISDKKIAHISRIVNQPRALILGIWTTLLAVASEADQGGKLEISPGIPYKIDDLSIDTGVEPDKLTEIIGLFVTHGMMDTNEQALGGIIKWGRRQFRSDNVTLRVQEHRARQTDETLQERFNDVTCNNFETPPESESESQSEGVLINIVKEGDKIFDESTPEGKRRKSTLEAMQRGEKKNGVIRDDIRRLFNITPNWNTKTGREFVSWYLRLPDNQSIDQFGRWWYQHDWRGKNGSPPTLGQIMELWLQAFNVSPNDEKFTEEYR